MKILSLKIVTALLLSCFISATIAQISGDGLIVYYPLRQGDVTPSGQIENLANNEYHLNAATNLNYVAGRNGFLNNGNGAVLLNGGAEQLNYDYSSNPIPFEQTGAFSIGAWVSLSAPYINEYQNIIVVGNNDMFLRFRKSGTSYFIQAGVRYSTNFYYSINYEILSPTQWLNDQWHHVALIRGGGYMALYVDDVEVGSVMSAVQPTLFNTSNKTFKVGHYSDPNTFFNGRISDVFYYNRALMPGDFARFMCDAPNVSPNTTFVDYCGPVVTSLSSNLPAGAISYDWYTTPFDGVSVHSGNNYPAGIISSTTTSV